jgi:hypothetical protein
MTVNESQVEGVEAYKMHVSAELRPLVEIETECLLPCQVSARYLELTKKKLELTRLPREIGLPDDRKWEYGTPKTILEPIVDFW